jgi:signal transduction histidine kinase
MPHFAWQQLVQRISQEQRRFWQNPFNPLQRRTEPRLRGVSLQPILVVPFVLEIALVVGVLGYGALRSGEHAVSDVATQLQYELSSRIDQHLDSYLSVPPRLGRLNAEAIESGVLNARDLNQIGTFFWRQVRLNSVGYLLYGSQSGELAAAGYYSNQAPLTIATLSPQRTGNHNSYAYEVNEKGQQTRLNFIFKDYQFQQEEWYAKTLTTGSPGWTNIYQWDTEPYPLSISAAYPVHAPSGKVIGAVGVDLRLQQISEFLSQIETGYGGEIFVIERNGLLVASSNLQEPLYTLQSGTPHRHHATDSQNPLLSVTTQQLIRRFGSLEQIQQSQHLQISVQGMHQFVQVTPWHDSLGLDWLVVVVLPEAKFVAPIHTNTQQTLVLCILAIGLASLFGIYTSRWITRPVFRLSRAAESLARAAQTGAIADLDTTVPASNIVELNLLSQSFQRMSLKLQTLFTEIEQTNDLLETRVAQRTEALSEALKELKLTQSQLVQTAKMSSLGQLVAGVAHEINNPVNFIHGNLEYLESYCQSLTESLRLYQKHATELHPEIEAFNQKAEISYLTEDLPNLIRSLQHGTSRIQEIVLSLRSFSRLDESGLKLVDIHEGIDSTLMILKSQLEAKTLHSPIEVVKHYGKIPPIACYPGRLNQVFMNLIANAIDAVEDFQSHQDETSRIPKIIISTRLNSPDCLEVEISDNGSGMTDEVVDKIFDPFFTTKPIGKGTGLGLSISYQIITKDHGGSLKCQSHLGKGTQFFIEIPLAHKLQTCPAIAS